MNLPHIQFYVGDWRKDLGIQTLSYYHRGVWFELLMLMHCSEQRGRLVLAGKPMPNAALSRLLGLSQQETQDALAAILDSGVASKDEAGTIYCRRMVREEEVRQKRRVAGSIGGSKRQANREQTPDIDNGTDGLLRVREFAREKGISTKDADWFYWKGRGNGWTNGGKPILDWKATLISWSRAGYLPSQKQQQQKNGARSDEIKKVDPSKVEVPERFKSWVSKHYPDKRDEAMNWRTWADVPRNGLRDEWWIEEKSKLPINL